MSNVPIDYFKLAVTKTLDKLIESGEIAYKFPDKLNSLKIELICRAADERRLHWKLVGDELTVIQDLSRFPINKFVLRSNASTALVVQMMSLTLDGDVDKENIELPLSPRTPTNLASPSSQSRAQHKETFNSPMPPKASTCWNDFNRPRLAILKHRDNFMNVYNNSQMVLVRARAGCGKSTQIPRFILDHHTALAMPCRIVVVNPSRICAVSAAERVSQELGESIGTTIGYQIKLESKTSPASNMIYMSGDFILAKLLHEKPSEFFQNVTTLIIDEIQERSVDIDFLILCVRELIDVRKLKVVLMTSRDDDDNDEILSYFDGMKVYAIPDQTVTEPPVAHLEDILKIENVFFTGHQLKEMQIDMFKSTDELTYEELLVQYYGKLTNVNVDLDLIAKLVKHLHFTTIKSHTILIFLPSYNDILQLANKLFNMLDTNCEIVSIDEQMQTDQMKLFVKFPATVRKIVLSTQLVESMLTIDDVEYVIDTGKERIDEFDAKSRTSSSRVDWICRRSAVQRATRVSHPNRGRVYRLYTSDQFESFADEIEPAMLSADITRICVMSKILAGSESIEDFLGRALTPPPCSSILQNIKLLHFFGALHPDDSVSQLGKCLIDLPMPLQYAKILTYGIFFRCIDPILTIVSILTVGNPFIAEGDDDTAKIVDIKKQLQHGSFSDLFVMLRAFQKWNEYKTSKIFDTSFCEQYSVGSGTLEMISVNRVRLVGHLRSTKMVQTVGNISALNEHSNNWSVLKACITAGLYPNIANVHGAMKTVRDEKVAFHPETALLTSNFDTSAINWIVYDKKIKVNNEMRIENCTIVSDACMALTSGSGIDLRIETTSANSRAIDYNIRIDQCLQLTGSEATAKALKFLRDQLNRLFDKFLADISAFNLTDPNDYTVYDGIVMLLKLEDEALGLKCDYERIGSRPRIVTREFDSTVDSYASSTTAINSSYNTTSSSLVNSSVSSLSHNLSQMRF